MDRDSAAAIAQEATSLDVGSPGTADPFTVFGIDEDIDVNTTVVTTVVWLVNRGLRSEVWADAGAGEVFLDTVAAGDSVRLRLASRADSIRLLARTLRGSPAGSLKVSLHADTTRFAFPP